MTAKIVTDEQGKISEGETFISRPRDMPQQEEQGRSGQVDAVQSAGPKIGLLTPRG